MVRGERQSKQIFYQIAYSHVSYMLTDMSSHIDKEHLDDYRAGCMMRSPREAALRRRTNPKFRSKITIIDFAEKFLSQ